MSHTAHLALAAILLSAILSGCASESTLPGPDIETQGHYVPLTKPIVVLGDTQEHESTGFPLHDNDSSIDAYVEVAQRPGEQTLFGRRLLEWVLSRNAGVPFIHLGDVMDLSCRSEAERIGDIFKSAGSPGVILPGNHDGLMFGIYAYNLYDISQDPEAKRWNQACRRGAHVKEGGFRSDKEALSKSAFISTYLETLAERLHSQPGPTIAAAGDEFKTEWFNSDDDAFLSAVEGKLIKGFGYADSFLIQRILLPRAPEATRDTVIIGLDTNQAGPLVSAWDTVLGHSPGDQGHIHPDQIEVVKKWVDRAVLQGDIVIFAGHHDWRSLGLPTRVMLRTQMAKLNAPLVYLSAHTHTGFWTVHKDLYGQPILELNVSSLSDWPLAYRRVSFAYDEKAQRLLVRGELFPKGKTTTTSDAELLAAWETETCAKSGVPVAQIKQEDFELVKQLRASRGTMLEWLASWLGPVCETCEIPVYEHALSYQDGLLKTLLEVDRDLGSEVHQLHQVPLPKWCGDMDFVGCMKGLMAERAAGFKEMTELFRRKAEIVDLFNEHLDDLQTQHAKTYMTCRAVQAAKIDFDLIDAETGTGNAEAKRRQNHFFLTEATIGME